MGGCRPGAWTAASGLIFAPRGLWPALFSLKAVLGLGVVPQVPGDEREFRKRSIMQNDSLAAAVAPKGGAKWCCD